jgi:FAD/FMN-containing dehydrogenase/Fe-S oxidoreductase
MTLNIKKKLTVINSDSNLDKLAEIIEGELRLDNLHLLLYAQDASIYRELPLGVVFPKNKFDLQKIVNFAIQHKIPLIPRGGGTSLGGQVVGHALIIDLGRYLNRIIELNSNDMTVTVEPGVVREELNRYLAPHGLMFAPETSTSNRCMIGGMIGNNSCGTNSIKYGSTRDYVVGMEMITGDGKLEYFTNWNKEQYQKALVRDDVIGKGLRVVNVALTTYKDEINDRYARSDVTRRNTGYPLDIALNTTPFGDYQKDFSLANFMCGTEGTLGIVTEAKLRLVPKPVAEALICVHFNSLDESFRATKSIVKFNPVAVEIIDKRTLDLALTNLEQQHNRFFVEGDPAAILAVSCEGSDYPDAKSKVLAIAKVLKEEHLGYAYPLIEPTRVNAVWELRREGLGIVMGQLGDIKPETLIEDAAVPVDLLPEYMAEVLELLENQQVGVMIYGHVSVGVVHLRPELNLKDPEHKRKFMLIADKVTKLIIKYRGSLSGEHGDGRIRAPLLPEVLGEKLMTLHLEIKQGFDPHGIFNPHKIVNPKPLDADWRVNIGKPTPEISTFFNWSAKMGLVRAVEKCNGVGACRKSPASGGTMCPSYMATLEEKDCTRGRANIFQQLFLNNKDPRNALVSEDLYETLDLCISCKGCVRECPSSIDMARMKAEFLQHYYDKNGIPLSAQAFGSYGKLARIGSYTPRIANFFMSNLITKKVISSIMNIAPERELPKFALKNFKNQFKSSTYNKNFSNKNSTVWLYVDPFTNFTEPEIALAAVKIINAGGFQVKLLPVADDGRTYISKGLLRQAKKLMNRYLVEISPLLSQYPNRPIIGIEPSAILTFKDELKDLVDDNLRSIAIDLGNRSYLLEEFILNNRSNYSESWKEQLEPKKILFHGHCHQKALIGLKPTQDALKLAGYDVETLPTGCCGMAGSFGYEKNHYELSQKIGELVLFPQLREKGNILSVVASGTSCRHQIKDALNIQAYHPITLLADQLITN